jgi:hypothetical protein
MCGTYSLTLYASGYRWSWLFNDALRIETIECWFWISWFGARYVLTYSGVVLYWATIWIFPKSKGKPDSVSSPGIRMSDVQNLDNSNEDTHKAVDLDTQ